MTEMKRLMKVAFIIVYILIILTTLNNLQNKIHLYVYDCYYYVN